VTVPPDSPFGHWVETFGEEVQAAAFADFGVRERRVSRAVAPIRV
jgi:hypothetical protein